MKIIKFITIGLLIAGAIFASGCKKEDNLINPNNEELIEMWNITNDGGDIPWGIAMSSDGIIYISELSGSRIKKFTSTGTLIKNWGTFGNNNGEFWWPKDITLDRNNNIYVADEKNHRIQKFDSSGTYIAQWEVDFAGTISADFENDWIYTINQLNVLQKFDLSGNLITHWGGTGSGDGQLMLSNQDNPASQGPNGQMVVSKTGNIFVVDNMNFRVQMFSSSGTFITKWGSQGNGAGQFLYPSGIAIDNENDFIYVSDNNKQFGGSGNIARIQKFDLSGNFIKQWILSDLPDQEIGRLAVDEAGNVLSIQGSRLVKYAFK
ncbi:MAG TPA: 6-bladed beta-propeller [Ignavibacteriaceae bacterium]|nr:6-bladed beta-propeller [Ignavibacteriaceae bacterium]